MISFLKKCTQAMSDNQRDPQYKLRWPEELRDKIAASAKEHNRSMNADIVARLENSLKFGDKTPIYMAESDMKAMNSLLALSFGHVMLNLIKNGVDKKTVLSAFPDDDVFTKMIELFEVREPDTE